MSPQSWQTLLIFVGSFLAAVGGVGSSLVGKRIESAKEERAGERAEHLSARVDELLEGNKGLRDRLAPLVETIADLYPDLDENAALDTLRDEVQEARARTDSLERRTAARSISKSQRSRIQLALVAVEPKVIVIDAVMGDQESLPSPD